MTTTKQASSLVVHPSFTEHYTYVNLVISQHSTHVNQELVLMAHQILGAYLLV